MGLASAARAVVSLVRRGEAQDVDPVDSAAGEHEREIAALSANRATYAGAVEDARRALEKAEQRAAAAKRRAEDALLDSDDRALEKARDLVRATEAEIASARRALAREQEGLATVERGLAEAREALAAARRATKIAQLRAAASAETFHARIAPTVDRALAAWSELAVVARELGSALASSHAASTELAAMCEAVPEARPLDWRHALLPLLARVFERHAPAYLLREIGGAIGNPGALVETLGIPRLAEEERFAGGRLVRALLIIAAHDRPDAVQLSEAELAIAREDLAAAAAARNPADELHRRAIARLHAGKGTSHPETPAPAHPPPRIFRHSERS